MGVSDNFLKPRYRMYLRNNLKSFNNLQSIPYKTVRE